MEFSISAADAKAVGVCSTQVTETIVRLVHRHLGLASVVNIEVVKDGISLTTANGTILVDQELTERIDT